MYLKSGRELVRGEPPIAECHEPLPEPAELGASEAEGANVVVVDVTFLRYVSPSRHGLEILN